MRVAVCQFATTSNTQENLASCIRMITKAALSQPSLIVLPQYCNTHFSAIDHHQAWHDALTIDGPFLKAIAQQAIKHHCYIVVNVTLRQKNQGDISVTSCLFCPLGQLVQQTAKQTLPADESKFFIATSKASEVLATPLGKLALISGDDSMTFESSRALALKGAQLLCNSIDSDYLDQSHLHDPARAVENNVVIATANKIGAGQSQIVSNDGRVLAKLDSKEEGVAFADIDLSTSAAKNNKQLTYNIENTVGIEHKIRPDGSQVIKQRRPELYLTAENVPCLNTYQTLTIPNDTEQTEHTQQRSDNALTVPLTTNVAIFATYKANEYAIDDVCQYIENNVTDIIQLPELFFVADKSITNDSQQREHIAALSRQFITQVSATLRPFQYLCTSLIIDDKHQAVLISQQGLMATQQQLHYCQRYQWTALGNTLTIITLPLEQGSITLAMLTADDANIAELVNTAALANIQLLLVPFDIQQSSEVDYSLLAHAAENRICIVAASREKDFANKQVTDIDSNNIYAKNKVKVQKSTGLIANLTIDPTLLPQWRAPTFNGFSNQPRVKYQYGKITKAVIHPIAACSKMVTDNYDN